jgi:hypothetical protein
MRNIIDRINEFAEQASPLPAHWKTVEWNRPGKRKQRPGVFLDQAWGGRSLVQGFTGLETAMPANQGKIDLLPGAIDDVSEMARLQRKFIRLRDEWKSSRGHEPSTLKVVTLPAYQKIIGMGPAVVPLLLRELETNLDNWFWALMVITEENLVSEDARGDGEAMAQAWLTWGSERGYKW